MKFRILIVCLGLLLISCKSTGYKFVEEFSGRKKEFLYKNLLSDIIFPKKGKIQGYFIEKKLTLNFALSYDMEKGFYDLKLYSLSGQDLYVRCILEKGLFTFKTPGDSLLAAKGKKIINFFQYLVAVYPKMDYIYRTADDFYVITDHKNYYKYDEKEIVKKENKSYTVLYRYSEDKKIDIIHFFDRRKKYIFKIHSIGERLE